MTRVHVDDDGNPDLDTLWYRVQIEAVNGFVELCSARWSALGVSEETAREEARLSALQNGYGIPDDPSGLDSSRS